MTQLQVQGKKFDLAKCKWNPVDVTLNDQTIRIPGMPDSLRTDKRADKKFMNWVFPKRPEMRDHVVCAGIKDTEEPRTITMTRELSADEQGRVEIVLPDGCKVVRQKSPVHRKGTRTFTLRPGGFSVMPQDMGQFSIEIGPVHCELKDIPAYKEWKLHVMNNPLRPGTTILTIIPVGYDTDSGKSFPMAPKDQAIVCIAAFEKAVGEAHHFETCLMTLPTVRSNAILAGKKYVERFVAAAESMKRHINTADDGSMGLINDFAEIDYWIGEAHEAISSFDRACLAYWNQYQVCVQHPDQVNTTSVVRALKALGIALKRSGRLEAAENCYRLALLEPMDEESRNGLFTSIFKARIQRKADEQSNRMNNELGLKNQTAESYRDVGKCAHCMWPAVELSEGENAANRNLKQCSGCKHVLFCSQDCQKKAWPTHKELCKSISERRKELMAGGK